MKTIELHGQEIKLEQRKCRGCHHTFKVMVGSPQEFHASWCDFTISGTQRAKDSNSQIIQTIFMPCEDYGFLND